jgi:hypothetical protein
MSSWYQFGDVCKGTSIYHTQQESNTMNPSAAIFIASDKARAVKCQYVGESDAKREAEMRGYTFKTMDQTLTKGDIVVVPTGTRHGFTCVKIIDVNVPIDTQGSIEYKWIVGKVDLEQYEKILAVEETVMAKIRNAEVARQRKQMRADLGEMGDLGLDDDVLMIEGRSDPVPEPAPAPVVPKQSAT